MKIINTRIYGLIETQIASGYPMIETELQGLRLPYEQDENRLNRLANAPIGSAHDCALKGIIVQADFIAPQYFWLQFGRYHFSDIVSSQSKMHKILNMDIKTQCNEYVDQRVINILNEYVHKYNNASDPKLKNKLFHMIISNVPSGLNLGARITTNYLQLKSQYHQRKNHKMNDWSIDFKSWVEGLPEPHLITGLRVD